MIKILRKPDVERITGLSHCTIWRLERAGEFPQRIKLSANTVGWRSDEIADWIDSRLRAGKMNFETTIEDQEMEIQEEIA